MNLIIALGSNIGDRLHNLKRASDLLESNFTIISKSDIYESDPVDYLEQPPFLNQLLEFHYHADEKDFLKNNNLKNEKLESILKITQQIEIDLGRVKTIDKGPRIIDIDIIFVGTIQYKSSLLTIPHPSCFIRDFIIHPIRELNCFPELSKSFHFPQLACPKIKLFAPA